MRGVTVERLDHLGIVAGVCREIGLAAYVDALDERQHERVSVGTATVAMVREWAGVQQSATLPRPAVLRGTLRLDETPVRAFAACCAARSLRGLICHPVR